MQTFLPYQSFHKSAQVLDRQRLGKQRVEAMQIINIITGVSQSKAWVNHPAVRMWRGYPVALKVYYNCIATEWIHRGYRHFMPIYQTREILLWDYPPWLTQEFCLSHRSNLIRKLPEHYGPMWPDVPDDLPYVWPV